MGDKIHPTHFQVTKEMPWKKKDTNMDTEENEVEEYLRIWRANANSLAPRGILSAQLLKACEIIERMQIEINSSFSTLDFYNLTFKCPKCGTWHSSDHKCFNCGFDHTSRE